MYIAIDIGGTKTIISGFKKLEPNSIVFTKNIPTGKNYEALKKELFLAIKSNTKKVDGIGISHCGIVDKEKGMCDTSTNLPEFEKKPIVQDFKKEFKCDVKIENDLVCGGIAEAEFGFGKTYNRVYYFTASTGIGGAFVYKVNGKRYIEQIESGHFVIKGEGLDSPTGQIDVLESYVGGRSMEKRFLKKPEEIDDLLLWEKQITYLATAVVNSIVMLHPEIVVLGGGMIEENEYVRKKLQIEIAEELRAREMPIIKITSMGKSVVVNGALALFK